MPAIHFHFLKYEKGNMRVLNPAKKRSENNTTVFCRLGFFGFSTKKHRAKAGSGFKL